MKTAKSYKLFILIAALFLSLITAFGMFTAKSVFADATTPVPTFMTVTNANGEIQTGKLSYAKDGENYNGKVKIDIEKDFIVKFDKTLVVEQSVEGAEFEMVLDIPEGVELSMNVKAKAFDVNGQRKTADDEYESEIVTDFDVDSNKIVLGVNEDNFIVYNGQAKTDAYYKVEVVDGRVPVSISFKVKNLGEIKSFYLVSVDQKVNDKNENDELTGKYKQTFELKDDGKLAKTAYPRVLIDKSAYVKTADGYVLNKVDGVGYTMKLAKYTLLDVTGTPYLSAKNAVKYGEGDNDKSITFTVESTKTFITFNLKENVETSMDFEVAIKMNGESNPVDVESFIAHVKTRNDNKAPIYDNSSDAFAQLGSLQQKLQEATIDKDTGKTVALGKTIKTPSLENLILDDMSSYADLTKTYHYWTPSESDKTTTSATSITLNHAGEYKVYVTATEKTATETLNMESDIFYDVKTATYYEKDDNGFTKLEETDAKVVDALASNTDEKHVIYIFSFVINDDAPLLVAAHLQSNGFVGVRYVANKFNITASGYTTTYKLFYNANVNANKDTTTGWVEIVAFKKASEDGANGYSYEELRAINYDGEVSFTPDKLGAYKIECEVTSQKSYKSASDTTYIKINAEPTIVEPANYWFRDNLASLVFLGIGVVCLIAIVVLLFIKPKDTLDIED